MLCIPQAHSQLLICNGAKVLLLPELRAQSCSRDSARAHDAASACMCIVASPMTSGNQTCHHLLGLSLQTDKGWWHCCASALPFMYGMLSRKPSCTPGSDASSQGRR